MWQLQLQLWLLPRNAFGGQFGQSWDSRLSNDVLSASMLCRVQLVFGLTIQNFRTWAAGSTIDKPTSLFVTKPGHSFSGVCRSLFAAISGQTLHNSVFCWFETLRTSFVKMDLPPQRATIKSSLTDHSICSDRIPEHDSRQQPVSGLERIFPNSQQGASIKSILPHLSLFFRLNVRLNSRPQNEL